MCCLLRAGAAAGPCAVGSCGPGGLQGWGAAATGKNKPPAGGLDLGGFREPPHPLSPAGFWGSCSQSELPPQGDGVSGGCCRSGRGGGWVGWFWGRVAQRSVGMLGALVPFISLGSGGAGPFASSHAELLPCPGLAHGDKLSHGEPRARPLLTCSPHS